MRRLLFLAALLPTLALAQHSMLKAGSEKLDPASEARIQAISKKLRCAVCQGLSIWDSGTSMAVAQVDVVRRLISEGKTDEEVRQYFVARYGEWILLEPKAEGFNLIVWVGPVLLLGLGFAVIFAQIRKAPAPAATDAVAPAPAPTPAAPAELQSYLDRVRNEVEQ